MAFKLNNRFSPNTHEKKEILTKLSQESYVTSYKNEILPRATEIIPLLAIANCTILLGYIKNGEFSEWLDKRHIVNMTADVLRPETALVAIILKAVNMFPKPAALLDRLIERLIDIRKKQDSNIDTTKTSKVV